MPAFITENMVTLVCLAIIFGGGILACGWMLGLNDRDQENACELAHTSTRLAQAEWLLVKSRANCKALNADLHEANERIRYLQECNRRLAMQASIASSPLEVRRGG